jgi:hypothetical protein
MATQASTVVGRGSNAPAAARAVLGPLSVGLALALGACGRPPADPVARPGAGERSVVLDVDSDGCRAGPDRDRDGLSDTCELRLARAFAPELVTSPVACDRTAGDPTAALEGGWLHAVGPTPRPERVRLAYLPAYARDCGWSGPKCVLPGSGCEGHAGDSELVALEVRSDGPRWHAVGVFLSAHCFDDNACRWRTGEDLGAFRWVGGAPVVFVAEGSHAGYPGRTACDRGHGFFDTCDRNRARFRFPVAASRNVGSRDVPAGGPGGCIGPPASILRSDTASDGRGVPGGADPVECIWAPDRPFRGWQRDDEGSPPTPYGIYLRRVLGW